MQDKKLLIKNSEIIEHHNIHGNKKLYKKHELQVVDNLIYTHRKYNKVFIVTGKQIGRAHV